MKKFSRIEKYKDKEPINITTNNNDLEIINYKGTNIINSKDKIAILPYLKDEGFLLLSYNNIPTYNIKNKTKINNTIDNNIINIITDNINLNETPEQAIKRILYYKCGISLSQTYPINVDNILYKNEQDSGQYYISLLELNYNDFHQNKLDNNLNSNIIRLNLGDIDTIKIYDLITDHLLLKLKYEYKI